MPVNAESAATHARSSVTWVAVVALLALPPVWVDVYLFSPQEEDAAYVIGRYSLLVGAGAAVLLVLERIRGRAPWGALSCALVAYVGVFLGRVLGSGEALYPWVIAAAAVVAGGSAVGMPGPHRRAAGGAAVTLAIVWGVGLLGLA